MKFEYPILLWLIPVLSGWLLYRSKSKQTSIAFSSLKVFDARAETFRQKWAWFPMAFRLLALALLLIALARPRVQVNEMTEVTRGIAIELLVDISSSMDMNVNSAEERITRLEAVKRVLKKFILGDDELLHGRPNDMLGLISFARYADTVSPLTSGHDALAELVEQLTIEDRPNEDGTAYGDAVTLASARLSKLDELSSHKIDPPDIKSRVIVLLTDGENNCGRHLPLEATAVAKQWDIKIYVISLADDLFPSRNEDALPEEPSAAEQILVRMAEETGGIYRSARDLDSLEAVYTEIDRLEKSEVRTDRRPRWREFFPLFAGIGFLFLVIETTSKATVFRRAP